MFKPIGLRRIVWLTIVILTAVPACAAGGSGRPDAVAVERAGRPSAPPAWLLAARRGGSGSDSNYQEWQSLSPAEKQQYRRRMEQLKQMPAADRAQFQRIFQKWQQLSPAEQQQIQQALDRWDSLPEDRKNAIRRRFQN